MDDVTVTRIGTQVVVRLAGTIDDRYAPRLREALAEVSQLALHRVVVDLTEADAVSGAGVDFLRATRERWTLRLIGPPAGLPERLADGTPRPPDGADGISA